MKQKFLEWFALGGAIIIAGGCVAALIDLVTNGVSP